MTKPVPEINSPIDRGFRHSIAFRYGSAILAVALATLARHGLEIMVGDLGAAFVTYYPTVLLIALITGGGPGILATLLSAATVMTVFMPPAGIFVASIGHMVSTTVFVCTCSAISFIAGMLRRKRWVEAFAAAKEQEAVDLSKANETLTQQSDELARQSEEAAQQSEEMARQNEELQRQSGEIQQLNEELARREDVLQRLLDSARLAGTEHTVTQDICNAAVAMFESAADAVVVFERHGEELTILAQSGLGTNVPAKWPLTNSLIEIVIAENKTGSLADASLRGDLAMLQAPGVAPYLSLLAAPIRIMGQPIGAVAVYSHKMQQWTAEQFRMAEWLAVQCSHILEVLRLQKDISERARLLDLSHDAVFVRDADDRITYWNKGAEEMYGYTAEEALGQKPRELLKTEFPLPVETVFESLKRDGRWNGEIVHTRKDGQKITVATRWALDRDTEGNIAAVLEINSDITARKQAIEALAASEQSVRRKIHSVLSPEGELGDLDLADIMDVPILQALMEDFYTLTRFPMALIDVKGKVLVRVGWQRICTQFHRTHPEICKHCVESDTELTTNVPPGEFRLYKCKNGLWDVATPVMVGGRHVGNIFTGQFFLDDEPVNRDFFRSQARRYGLDEEAYLAALDAVPRMNRRMVNICMAFLSRLAQTVSHLSYSNIKLARSLAEGQRLTDSLRESELFYRQTLESIPGMVFTTRPDGYCDYQSQQWVEFTGVPMSEHVGEGWNRLLHPDDQPRALEAWRAAVEGRAPYDLEYRVRGRDGHYAWFKVLGKPIRDAEGQIARWFGVAANIDAIKKAEEELQRVAEDLRRSNRDLEQFAYVASHDLQEPLRQTAAFTGLLRDRYHDKLDEQGRQYCNFVIEGAERMQDLVKGLLEYSRVDSRGAVPEPADGRDAVQAAISSLRTSIEESGAQISVGELPIVRADKCQLMQLFQNLLGNAIKFRSDKPPCIEVGASQNEDHWLFWVKDNGIGLEDKYREKIFVIFQRLHTRVKIPGTGIGLSICKKIVERHGGRIWVESRPGEGATFFFTIPMCDDRQGNANVEATSQ